MAKRSTPEALVAVSGVKLMYGQESDLRPDGAAELASLVSTRDAEVDCLLPVMTMVNRVISLQDHSAHLVARTEVIDQRGYADSEQGAFL